VSSSKRSPNRYDQIIGRIFLERYQDGAENVFFERDDLIRVSNQLGIPLPKNLGDILYSFRYRAQLPQPIREKAPQGKEWVIKPAGRSRYCFSLTSLRVLAPSEMLAEIKIPDATPGIISKYALSDEQALLAKLRHNRLIDIFTGVTCYSLQSHLRTTVPGIGQVETDEIYVGLDRKGVHYVLPVQAKASRERLGIIQIEQDFALCQYRFPSLICIPVAAQYMRDDLIALFAFEMTREGSAVSLEKHYRLAQPEDVTLEDLESYRLRPQG